MASRLTASLSLGCPTGSVAHSCAKYHIQQTQLNMLTSGLMKCVLRIPDTQRSCMVPLHIRVMQCQICIQEEETFHAIMFQIKNEAIYRIHLLGDKRSECDRYLQTSSFLKCFLLASNIFVNIHSFNIEKCSRGQISTAYSSIFLTYPERPVLILVKHPVEEWK